MAQDRSHLRIPFADRFWSHVAVARLPNDAQDFDRCWPWLGKVTGTQQLTGAIRLPAPSRRMIVAPRAALLLWEGVAEADLERHSREVRRSLDAGHTVCDNPACCNPTHLAWQPHKENIHEYIRKFKKLAGKPMDPSRLTNSTL